jgi:hypothetical protein
MSARAANIPRCILWFPVCCCIRAVQWLASACLLILSSAATTYRRCIGSSAMTTSVNVLLGMDLLFEAALFIEEPAISRVATDLPDAVVPPCGLDVLSEQAAKAEPVTHSKRSFGDGVFVSSLFWMGPHRSMLETGQMVNKLRPWSL